MASGGDDEADEVGEVDEADEACGADASEWVEVRVG